MASFDAAYAATMGHEGGYANNPADTGGETYKGIARNFNGGWFGWPLVDAVKKTASSIKEINQVLGANEQLQRNVNAWYKKNYWDVNNLDQVNDVRLAGKLFDIGVNMGVGRASRLLQEALNLTNLNGRAYPDLTIDGVVGPATISRVNNHPQPNLLYKVVQALQGERYLNIMRANGTQEVFAGTWFSRI